MFGDVVMVGINRLPPTGGSSGLGGMASPENNRPQTPPPTPPTKALTDPNSMSSFLSGPMSSWLVQNSSAYSPSDLSDLQRQISDTAASLQNPSTSITENLSQFNDLMGQLGFPLGDADMAQQMQTAASSLDSSAQKQLSSYTSQVDSISTKVHAASGSSADANEILEQMEETSQQLTSLASGISSAAMATEQLSDSLQAEAPGASLSDVSTTFTSASSQYDAFNAHAQNALAALPSQLAKIQSSLKTLQASEAQQVVGTDPYQNFSQLYNAVNQLWCLLIMRESENPSSPLPANSLQNMYMLASAVSQFMSAYNGSNGAAANDPAMYHIYELLSTPEQITDPNTGQSSYASLAFICSGASSQSALMTASQTLLNNYNSFFTGNAGPDIFGSVMQNVYNFLMEDQPNFFAMEASEGNAPPGPSMPTNVEQDLTNLISDMTNQNPPNALTVAGDIKQLMTDLENSTTPNDGYTNFLISYLNAPLDAQADSLASLAQSGGSQLQGYLESSGIITDFTTNVGNYGESLFSWIDNYENPQG